jgi:cytochrome oxidase Cu insertion factor (SCO1/SenC/PrrC family)
VSAEQPEPVVKARRVSPRDRVLLALLAAVVMSAAVFGGLALRTQGNSQAVDLIRPSGIPAAVSTSQANLMALSPVPDRPAPDFRLTDQHGRTLSLSTFKGHVVVLGFTDPHCTDVCPIVSQETVDAFHDLGRAASNVVFLSVNVNPYVTGVSDMAGYTERHQLSSVPSWHFLTGSAAELQSVWHAYSIAVDAPTPTADVQHTDALYFIDPTGHERYLASPMVDHDAQGTAYLPADQLTSWGEGIALVSRHLTTG